MSNAEQAVGAVAGAVIGFVSTGFSPVGAYYGFQIGLLAGTVLFPTQLPTQRGPRMEDLATTVAQLGNPVGITYGTFAVPGQIMALGCVTETERRDHVGGKGAPEQTVVTFTYTQTIAVGLCEGIICGVLRIWENGELKYDVRDQQVNESSEEYAARIESSAQYATTFTLYTGTEEQEPDPDLEVVYGEGLVPAFRGLAYIVFPERVLSTEQALRHPQWRFEVVRGTGVRGVTEPTLIDGVLDGFQTNHLHVDWIHNRFFSLDNTGGSSGFEAEGIRAFTLRNNTEYLQRTYADIGILEPIGHYHATVGLDGFLYLCFAITNDDGVIYKLDPSTLDIVVQEPISLFSNQWWTAITTRATALGLTADFLISASLLLNRIVVRRCDTLNSIGQVNDGREEIALCRGPYGGAVSLVYALCYNEHDFTAGDPVELRRISCGIVLNAEFEPTPAVDFDSLGTIAVSDFKADWLRIEDVGGLAYDASDDTLVFSIRGSPNAGLGGTETRIVKFDPATMEFVWNVEDTSTFKPTSDQDHGLTRLNGGDFVHASSAAGHLVRLNLQTGEQTTEDWLDVIPGNQTFTGEEIWDDITGCLITFVQDVGPVLICDSGCDDEAVTLGEIVEDVCLRSGVPDDGYDVSELIQTVHGYGILANMSGRAAIEALRPVGSFDALESGTVIKFPVRGREVSKTFEEEELGAHEQGTEPPPSVITEKVQSVELPRIVRVHYIAPSRDYEPGEKLSPSRFSPGIENEMDVQVPVALDDSQAFQMAEVIHSDVWAGRWSHQTSWDVSQLAREPTDVVLLPVDDRLYRCRITEINDLAGGLLRRSTLVRDDDGSYTSTAIAPPPQIIGPAGPRVLSESSLLILDLPPLREEDDDAGVYAAVYRTSPERSWSGTVIARSADAGATYSQLVAVSVEATVGTIVEVLGSGPHTVWDDANELIVNLNSGSFESREESAVIGGANAVAVGANGRWEILQFRDAEVIGEDTYRLTHLLRGRRGTEPYIGTSQAGDSIVVLSDGAITRLPLQTSEIGQERLYRATSVGLAAGATTPQEFIGQGRALESWAPVMIEGERAAGDLTITFQRRSRFGSDLTPAWQNLPLTETPEAYEIDIIGDSDGDVLRTIDTSVESAVYTAAEQTTDFGSPQASVTVKIYQMSTIVGRGLAGEATI